MDPTLIDQVALCLYLGLYTIVTGWYAWTIHHNSDNFYVFARHPRLLYIDLLVTTFIVVSYGIQQCFADVNRPVTRLYTQAVTFVGMCIFMPLHLLKSARLVVIFSPRLRPKYGRLWTRSRLMWMLRGCYCLAIVCWAVSLFMSELVLTLAIMVVITGVLVALICMVKREKVNDQLGIMREQQRLLGCVVFWFCVVFPLLLDPLDLFSPAATTRFSTWLLMLLVSAETVIVHVIPSVHNRYDPVRSILKWHRDRGKPRVMPRFASSVQDPRRTMTLTVTTTTGLSDVNQFKLLPAYNEEFIALLQQASRRSLCEENMLFLLAVNDLQRREDGGQVDPRVLMEGAAGIVARYVRPGSEYEVNISSAQVQRCLHAFAEAQAAYGMPVSPKSGYVRKGAVSPKVAPPPAAAGALGAGEGGAGVGRGHKIAEMFNEAFREIEKMLAQNIMPHVESLEAYQVLQSRQFIQTLELPQQ